MATEQSVSSSPSRATIASRTTFTTSTNASMSDDDDLDPAAFLASVRELSAKREREDNERFRKLEEEIEKGRQERLARRAEYARSISPEKRDEPAQNSQDRVSRNLTTPRSSTTSTTTPMTTNTSSSRTSPGVETVPDFTGFRSASPSTPTKQSPSLSITPSMQPSPIMKPSPSAAMPSRSGTVKWQQRPQSRAGVSRPLSMVAAENHAQSKSIIETREPTRDEIATSLSKRDPLWFRQTEDRGHGNAALRKSVEDSTPEDTTRYVLPGMASNSAAKPTGSISTTTSEQSRMSRTSTKPSIGDVAGTSSTRSEKDDSVGHSQQSSSTIMTAQNRLARGLEHPSSPTKEMGGFVQSAMMKRSNSINKRSVGHNIGNLDRATSIRSGYGGLQGSHSMPKLDQPDLTSSNTTDSLVRPLSSMNLTQMPSSALPPSSHSRSKSITSAYTTNDNDHATSVPSSPSRRWSPTKSSWIESALLAKSDSRPASPTKNSQPAWMADLAKANAKKTQKAADLEEKTHHLLESQPSNVVVDAIRKESTGTIPVTSAKPNISKPPMTDKPKQNETMILSDQRSTSRDRNEMVIPSGNSSTSKDLDITSSTITTAAAPLQKHITPISRPRPQPSPKPQIDFRATLKPRAATEPEASTQPEFLARFSTLRKATTEKYVAPDPLRDNILRGKAGLSLTDGPQTHERKDEFKDSLLARKDQWRQEKQDGIVHERKTSLLPITPQKPEALAKREVLGRAGSIQPAKNPEREKATTPEALRKHQSIRTRPLENAPDTREVVDNNVPVDETSKLAARYNPQLARMLAQGPPPVSNNTNKTQTTKPEQSASSDEVSVHESHLHDVRKGRARGPKRRKAGTATMAEESSHSVEDVMSPVASEAAEPVTSAMVMMTSLEKSSPKPAISPKPASIQAERIPLGWESPRLGNNIRIASDHKTLSKPVVAAIDADDDKENAEQSEDVLQSNNHTPIPIQSQRDEEAAMRSARLLASRSPVSSQRPPNGLGISNGPIKPAKSSRTVSGQLQEASLNKVLISRAFNYRQRNNDVIIPPTRQPLRIDARPLLRRMSKQLEGRTMTKTLYKIGPYHKLEKVEPQHEYTVRETGTFLLKHTQAHRNGTVSTNVYIWLGRKAIAEDIYTMNSACKGFMLESRSTRLQTVCQGYETEEFLRAIGGILITRLRTVSRSESYILCGQKHLGHITFDEIDCPDGALCSAFVYLIWYPTTVKQSTVYIWKGLSCTAEEVGAARLAAMDIASDAEIVEVNDGVEQVDFWKIFSSWPIRAHNKQCPDPIRRKIEAMDKFDVRLFRIQQREVKQNFFASIMSRRPSWTSRSPVRDQVINNYEAIEISPFTQADLDAEGVFMLDGYTRLDVLIGPLSSAQSGEDALYKQALHFAEDYAELCMGENNRIARPEVFVLYNGLPNHLQYLFRHWKDEYGLWSTAGLMAGSAIRGDDMRYVTLHDARLTIDS